VSPSASLGQALRLAQDKLVERSPGLVEGNEWNSFVQSFLKGHRLKIEE
jgi:hypothetical protein